MKKQDLTRRELLGAGGAIVVASAAQAAVAQSSLDLPEGIKSANVSLIATTYSKMGINELDYSMSHDIKPLTPDGKTMIGPAVTCKWEIGTIEDMEDVNKYIYDPLDQAPAGSVWVIESGTDEIYSMFGDIITLACSKRGMLGAVTDNGCRDIEEIKKQGFAVFAKSTIPYGPKGLRPVGANVPITFGGVTVNPGDLIAADIDGVIVIPKELIMQLNEGVAEHLAYEQEVRAKVEAGETLRSAYPY